MPPASSTPGAQGPAQACGVPTPPGPVLIPAEWGLSWTLTGSARPAPPVGEVRPAPMEAPSGGAPVPAPLLVAGPVLLVLLLGVWGRWVLRRRRGDGGPRVDRAPSPALGDESNAPPPDPGDSAPEPIVVPLRRPQPRPEAIPVRLPPHVAAILDRQARTRSPEPVKPEAEKAPVPPDGATPEAGDVPPQPRGGRWFGNTWIVDD